MAIINYQTTNSSLHLKSMDEKGYFTGYASVFNNVDQQNDLIVPGAFAACIEHPKNIKLLWQHLSEEPIGVIEELREDAHGLYIKARLLLDLVKGREIYTLLSSGAVNGLSIGYKIDNYSYDVGGIRCINKLTLLEVSVVTFPANVEANVTQVKSCDEVQMLTQTLDKTIATFETFLY